MIVNPKDPVQAGLAVITDGALLSKETKTIPFEEPDELVETHAPRPRSAVSVSCRKTRTSNGES